MESRRRPRDRNRAGGRAQGRYLLSGLLACGLCGGGFWAIDRRGVFGCGARKDRGRAACGCELRVAADDLEGRIVGALRDQVLTEENVARVADRALQIVQEQLGAQSDDPTERLKACRGTSSLAR